MTTHNEATTVPQDCTGSRAHRKPLLVFLANSATFRLIHFLLGPLGVADSVVPSLVFGRRRRPYPLGRFSYLQKVKIGRINMFSLD